MLKSGKHTILKAVRRSILRTDETLDGTALDTRAAQAGPSTPFEFPRGNLRQLECPQENLPEAEVQDVQ